MTNKRLKVFLLSFTLLAILLLICSCSGDEGHYASYDEEGYTVSVKFDANGGSFSTGVSTIVDSYNTSLCKENGDGNKEIFILDPSNKEIRGDQSYDVGNADLCFAGWYRDMQICTDDDGNLTCQYSGRWDFTEPLVIDADGDYTAEEPVMTLYAAWVPKFTYEFYAVDENGDEILINTKSVNPTLGLELDMPIKDASSGRLYIGGGFPNEYINEETGVNLLDSMSYDGIYLDSAMTLQVSTETLTHSGNYDPENVSYGNTVMKIYCSFKEGLWYEVNDYKSLKKYITKNNVHLILTDDIDFGGRFWGDMANSEFNGEITSAEGECYSIMNVALEYSSSSSCCYGIFGSLGSDAVISNVTFSNIVMDVKAGAKNGDAIGLLAGSIHADAVLTNVSVKDSKFVISASKNVFFIDNITYGFVSGNGSTGGVDFSVGNTVEYSNFNSKDEPLETEYETSETDANGRFTVAKVS